MLVCIVCNYNAYNKGTTSLLSPSGGGGGVGETAAARLLEPWYPVRGECMMDVDSAAPAAGHTRTHTLV